MGFTREKGQGFAGAVKGVWGVVLHSSALVFVHSQLYCLQGVSFCNFDCQRVPVPILSSAQRTLMASHRFTHSRGVELHYRRHLHQLGKPQQHLTNPVFTSVS